MKLTLRSQVGKQLVLDKRSEGEIFGLLSLMGRDLTRLDVTAHRRHALLHAFRGRKCSG